MLSDDNVDDDGFFRYKKNNNVKRFFVTCLGVQKLQINEQDVSVRTCQKVKHTSPKLYENKGRT